ncbi:MAG: hypothetical protein R3D45_06205 [Rhizobiaceae bacterium]
MRAVLKWTAAGLAAIAALAIVPASAGSPGACASYAAKAVQQFQRNLSLGCGFGGPRWSGDYAAHFAWCLIAETSASNHERNVRDSLLAQCSVPQAQTFHNPKVGGVRLDWCRVWANQCGRPAARAYCQSKGYNRASSWTKANNIGYTRIISSGQICNLPTCDGFRRIRCTN